MNLFCKFSPNSALSCATSATTWLIFSCFSGTMSGSEAWDYFLDRTSRSPPSSARPGSWPMDSRLWQKWRVINDQLNLTSEPKEVRESSHTLLVWSFNAMVSWLKSQFVPSDNSFTPDYHDVGSALCSGVESVPWFVFLALLFQQSPVFLHEQRPELVTQKKQPCIWGYLDCLWLNLKLSFCIQTILSCDHFESNWSTVA